MEKIVLVTGASQGIGAFICRKFAENGYNIAINCRSEVEVNNGGNSVAEECRAFGVLAECFIADVSNYSQCETMIKAVVEKFGKIDVLINNAGITKDGLLPKMSEENYDMVIAVNQKSVFNMMKFVSKIMIKQRFGKIINISSVAGIYGNAGQFNYSASKAAIIAMTKTAAKELGGRSINVNAVAPGLIQTPMTDVLTDEQKKAILSQVALKRFGKVEEIASVVLFLASEGADYITGQTIEISGGLSM